MMNKLFCQVHGPITREFAINKLAKLNFKKGSYLVRQSAETQGKVGGYLGNRTSSLLRFEQWFGRPISR